MSHGRTVLPTIFVALISVAFAGMTAQAQTYKVLDALTGGQNPANIVSNSAAQGRNGDIYVSAIGGRPTGSVLQLNPKTGKEQEITPVGGYMVSGVTLGTDGNFYGTDQDEGQYGDGQVFKISSTGKKLTDLHDFYGPTDGGYPNSAPIQHSNGLFYGTTMNGGSTGAGTIYSISSTGKFTLLHTFDPNTEGYGSLFPLLEGPDGNLYGTLPSGGPGNGGGGTIYQMTPSGQVTVLWISDNVYRTDNGTGPSGALVLGNDGNLYGSTSGGGLYGEGTIFNITTSGEFTALYSLNPATDGYMNSAVTLFLGSDGLLYGATTSGRGGYPGSLFNVSTTGQFKTLYTMCSQPGCTDGDTPNTPVYQNTNGIFYGGTAVGGVVGCGSGGPGCGVLYSLNMGLKPFVSLVNPIATVGATVQILGQGFSAESVVSFNGVQSPKVKASAKFIEATVPAGASSGFVTVTTGSSTLTSAQSFWLLP